MLKPRLQGANTNAAEGFEMNGAGEEEEEEGKPLLPAVFSISSASDVALKVKMKMSPFMWLLLLLLLLMFAFVWRMIDEKDCA